MKSLRTCVTATVVVITVCLLVAPPTHAQETSSRPADLVDNERVIYSLPDVGGITPENPLFVLKQVRDNLLLAMPQDSIDKAKLLIQMNDKYTVYADKLAHLSKLKRSTQMFETAMSYQAHVTDILKDELPDATDAERDTLGQIRNVAIQSNIKQAEMIRTLFDVVPASEQPALVQLLDKNIQLRKKLQSL